MSVVTYRCPNCGGELTFEPSRQKFSCEYCDTDFTQEQIHALYPEEADAAAKEAAEKEYAAHTKTYECPSCGACIVTDDTTAGLYCCYCHTPVILSERLSGGLRPAGIIPFVLGKETAGQCFLNWCRGKWFVPKDFKAALRLAEMSGVYLPFWLTDCNASAEMKGSGRKVRSWRVGNTRYTETKIYQIRRGGKLFFPAVPVVALRKTDANLISGIMPYDDSKIEDFSMSYLSGFVTERYDRDEQAITPEVWRQVRGFSKEMLKATVSGYSGTSFDDPNVNFDEMKFRYVLYPTWFLTYRYKEKLYYFAVNGQSGRAAGELPLDKKKLLLTSGLLALAVFLFLLLGGTFLW